MIALFFAFMLVPIYLLSVNFFQIIIIFIFSNHLIVLIRPLSKPLEPVNFGFHLRICSALLLFDKSLFTSLFTGLFLIFLVSTLNHNSLILKLILSFQIY